MVTVSMLVLLVCLALIVRLLMQQLKRLRKCPCCGAKYSEPATWHGCECGLPHTDCANGKCDNGPHHNRYGCGMWQEEQGK